MKLITLNIWGGHVLNPLLEFIQAHQDIDIFCLQEVYHQAPYKVSDEDREVSLNIFSELGNLLPDHIGFFRPTVNQSYGLGLFVKKSIDVLDEGDITIHHNPTYKGTGPTHSRNLQWLTCRYHDQTYSIFNVHGLWNGMGKTDSEERLAQSQRIKMFMEGIDTSKILCGDFNLRPDTQSLEMLEHDMLNLIKSHKVTSTRTSLYPKDEKFADYILVSKDVAVNQFSVLTHEVSDHAPLLLEFE